MTLTAIPGERIEFKRRSGLGGWSPGELVSRDGKTCVVRERSGVERVVLSKLVRDPKGTKARPRRALVRAPRGEPRTVSTGTTSGVTRPKEPRFRDDAYLAFVRTHPCCSCNTPAPNDPHHFGRHATGMKAHDTDVVPLCRACHDVVHTKGALVVSDAAYASLDDRAATAWLFQTTSRELLAAWHRGERGAAA